MMRQIDGYVRGSGLGNTTTRQIIEKVAAGMPLRIDEEPSAEARLRMIQVSA